MNNTNEKNEHQAPPPVVMLQMISGFWVSRLIYTAARLGLADEVKDGPKTAEELAAATNTHAPSLYRLLRGLASVGIFAEDGDNRFTMTPLAGTLQSDAPGSMRSFAISELGLDHYQAWGDLMHSITTGETAFEKTYDMKVWDFYARNPENGGFFIDAMNNLTKAENAAVVGSYDFSSTRNLVDVAGGDGSLLIDILKANPSIHCTLFEEAHVLEEAKQKMKAAGQAERCQYISGDFFQSVPPGGDTYILKWILHDWDDERSRKILENCRKAMPENSKLLVIEITIPSGNEPCFGKLVDLNMLVMTGGRERSEKEFRSLLEASGFKITTIVPTKSPKSIIECIPV